VGDQGVGQVANTWNSETCAADQPLLAVKLSWTYWADVAGNVMVTVFPVDGLKV
jgi:hypothetical protein